MADDFLLEYSDLIHDDGTFEELSANIKQAKAELIDLAKATKKAFSDVKPGDVAGIEKREKAIKEIEATQKKLIKTEKAVQVARKKTIELTNEELIQLQKNKIAQRERIAIAKQQAIIQNKASGEIEKLRARLALTTLQWKKITAEEKKNNTVLNKTGDTAKSVIATKLKLTNQLKKLERQTGDTRREVGNYGKALGKTGRIAARVFIGRSIVDGLRSISGALGTLIDDFKESDAEIGKVASNLEKLKGGLQQFGLFFLRFISGPLDAFVSIADSASKAIFGVGIGAQKASVGVRDLQNEFNAEIEVLKRGNISTEAKSQLITDINEKYKEYLPNLIDENASLEDITRAQNAANVAFTKKITLLASEEQFIDITKRRLDALREQVILEREVEEATKKSTKAADLAVLSSKAASVSAQDAALSNAQNARAVAKSAKSRLAENKLLLDQIAEEKRLLDEVIKSEGINTADFLSNQKEKTAAVKTGSRTRKEAEIDNSEARLKAIAAVEKLLEKAEIDNIESKQERLIELEEARFREEQKLRKLQFESDTILLEGHEEELFQLQQANDKLGQEQEIAHTSKLTEITQSYLKTRFDAKRAAREKERAEDKASDDKDEADRVSANEKRLKAKIVARKKEQSEEAAARLESNEARKKANEELISGIQKSAQKVGAIIVDLFKKQADLSANNVNEQQQNRDRADERAQKGLKANLAFEESELSKRQLEQQQRQKEAEQAARILTLFNLVSAYAASGDKNALARGFVDFGLLTAFSAGLTRFYEGTENVNEGLGRGNATFKGKDGFLGNVNGRNFRFDGDERIMSSLQNALLGDMSNDDLVTNALLGSQMSDYYPAQSPVQQMPYQAQRKDFETMVKVKVESTSNDAVVKEIKAMRKQMASQPNYSAQIVKSQEDVISLMISEQKKGLKKLYTKIMRSK